MSLSDLRKEYTLAGLRRMDLSPDPILQFSSWLDAAIASGLSEPTAMSLATADAKRRPSCRTVLLKGVDQRGFIFFTNYESRKGRELAENPRAALTIYWKELERQICIAGDVIRLPANESEIYFQSRPLGSRLAAWVSRQTETIKDRAALEQTLQEVTGRFPGENVPLPPYWGGFVVQPLTIEFWQGRLNRLHDRFRYTKQKGSWLIERLAP